LVGASYASNNLDKLESWVCSLSKLDTAKFLEINTSLNGFVNTERLHHFLNKYVASDNAQINALHKQYATVATELETGREIWLTTGSVLEAVWSSISLPGLFPAIRHDNKWLIDGGLVNPIPVSLCRALGADIVIAVNLNGDIVGRHSQKNKAAQQAGVVDKIADLVSEYAGSIFTIKTENQPPSVFEAIAGSINIVQDRITRSRMAGDPPDVLLSPKLSHIGLLEFYKAHEAIHEGKECVRRMLPEIHHALNAL